MKFPIIIIFGDNSFVRCRKSEFKKFDGKFISGNQLRLKNSAKRQFRITQIIDYEGKIYDLIPLKFHRLWLAPLSSIIDLVSMDAKLSEGKSATISEVAQIAKSWKSNSARQFRRFLSEQEPSRPFDSKMFRAAWEHSYMALPEDEWGEHLT